MTDQVYNIVFAGLGGQGVLTSASILAAAAFLAGFDVKQSEIHGMSQRGGSVTSDVRFGQRVWSPMVTVGEADAVVVLTPNQERLVKNYLKPDGWLLVANDAMAGQLDNKRSLNVALLGGLSLILPIAERYWEAAIEQAFAPPLREANNSAFACGRRFFMGDKVE